MTRVCRDLIMLLSFGDSKLKLGMKLVKVHNKLFHRVRNEFSFDLNSEIRMVTFVGEEGQDASSSRERVVVSELGHR